VTNHLFCYGTLKRGQHNNLLLAGCEFIGVGKAHGCVLINLGSVPGMLPGKMANHSDDAIGEVYEIPNEKLAYILPRLDRFENNGEMYVRVVMTINMLSCEGCFVTGADRRTLECFTYLYMPHLDANSPVSGGNWLGTLARKAVHSSGE
jgi:gamma-glutamylcyclotransferase (GGCT)/AIG2-like uncharacterized protein YtfP